MTDVNVYFKLTLMDGTEVEIMEATGGDYLLACLMTGKTEGMETLYWYASNLCRINGKRQGIDWLKGLPIGDVTRIAEIISNQTQKIEI